MKEMTRKIPPFASGIVRRLEQAGFEAWLVGGCVRDLLRGEEPHDYDIATAARPDEVAAVFPKTIPTGVRYGTVTVFWVGGRAEVTTFRGESGYSDGRRPDAVQFGKSLTADLSRRDFTVNAMALHPQRGLRDPFGGEADLRAGLIRAVGEPRRRFAEDALRILRAYRFAARLGCVIEPATLAAARAAMERTGRLSGERIRGELDALLLGPRPGAALTLGRDGLFAALGFGGASFTTAQPFPGHLGRPKSAGFAAEGLQNTGGTPGRAFCGCCKMSQDSLCNTPLGGCPATRRARWAAFFALTSLPAEAVCRRLRFDNAARRDIAALLMELGRETPRTDADIRRRLGVLPPELYQESLRVRQALTGRDLTGCVRRLDDILARGDAYSLSSLAVSGKDLRDAGIPAGPEYARILARLLDRVVAHPEQNRPEILRALIPFLRDENFKNS